MAVTETEITSDRPVVNLLDPEFYNGDQHAAYRWMRANEPVYRDHESAMWGITRHHDLHEVERRSDVFISSGPKPCRATIDATERRRARSRMATPTIEGVSLGLFTASFSCRLDARPHEPTGDFAPSGAMALEPGRGRLHVCIGPGGRQQLLGLSRFRTALLRAQAFGKASQ